MEEWETERRWREEEESACSFHLSAVDDQLHLLSTLPACQEMLTLAPALATNSSSSVQFEPTASRFAPLTVRVGTFREEIAEEREVGGEEEQEPRVRERMKRHSRRLILRKPS